MHVYLCPQATLRFPEVFFSSIVFFFDVFRLSIHFFFRGFCLILNNINRKLPLIYFAISCG